MPAPEARDQTIVAQLLTELATIGTGPTEWLTNPPDAIEGSPADPIDDSVPLQLYLDHFRTAETDQDAGGINKHNRTLQARVWILAKVDSDGSRGRATVRRCAADVVRALQAAEGTFQTLTGSAGVRVHDFNREDAFEAAGFAVGRVEVSVQYEQDHSAP